MYIYIYSQLRKQRTRIYQIYLCNERNIRICKNLNLTNYKRNDTRQILFKIVTCNNIMVSSVGIQNYNVIHDSERFDYIKKYTNYSRLKKINSQESFFLFFVFVSSSSSSFYWNIQCRSMSFSTATRSIHRLCYPIRDMQLPVIGVLCLWQQRSGQTRLQR